MPRQAKTISTSSRVQAVNPIKACSDNIVVSSLRVMELEAPLFFSG
jgi:hypothetical protein